MPCYTVTKVTLALKGEIVRMEWLKSVIERVTGQTARQVHNDLITWNTGQYDRKTGLITERTKERVNQIRTSYAAELTKRTLGRAGWQVREEKEVAR